MRLFTQLGIEITEHDIVDLSTQEVLFFSFGDDFDYCVRINALKFIKLLGRGGFGIVDLCFDELSN